MKFLQLASALPLIIPALAAVIPRGQSLSPLHISANDDVSAFYLFDPNPSHSGLKHPRPPHHPPHDEKPGDGDSSKTILDVISEDKAFEKLYHLIKDRETIVRALNSSDADVTLFAPVNSAFFWPGPKKPHPPPEVITQGLLYHIVDHQHKEEDLVDGQLLDTGLSLGSLGDRPQKIRVFEHNHHVALNLHSKIIKEDIKASNGIIQAVNHVVIPPRDVFFMTAHFPRVFGLLTLAIKRAGLEDYLKETKAITLFAPTNRAFKKLGLKKLKYLFSHKGKEELKKILSYHVSTELIYGKEIIDAKEKSLPTAEGHKLDVKVKDEDPEHGHKHQVIEINGEAHVVVRDGIAANGVLHAIDKVLCPEEDGDGESALEEEDSVLNTVLDILVETDDDDEGFSFAL